jgi:hypothetical protein
MKSGYLDPCDDLFSEYIRKMETITTNKTFRIFLAQYRRKSLFQRQEIMHLRHDERIVSRRQSKWSFFSSVRREAIVSIQGGVHPAEVLQRLEQQVGRYTSDKRYKLGRKAE